MIDYNKLRVRIRLDNLRHNFRLFNEIHDNVIPVIKSDAYGHGLVEVARALEKDGAKTFAVGFVHEAVKLRESGCDKRIMALLGPVFQCRWDRCKSRTFNCKVKPPFSGPESNRGRSMQMIRRP